MVKSERTIANLTSHSCAFEKALLENNECRQEILALNKNKFDKCKKKLICCIVRNSVIK